MTRRSYLRLELPGLTDAHRDEAAGARFGSLTAPIVPLVDLWDRPPTREPSLRALHPHPKLQRLAGIQCRPLADLEADVHLASARAFRRSIDEGGVALAILRSGVVVAPVSMGPRCVVSWEEIIDAYCLSCAFVDVRLGWGEEERDPEATEPCTGHGCLECADSADLDASGVCSTHELEVFMQAFEAAE